MMRRFWVGVALGCAIMLAAAVGCNPQHRLSLRQGATDPAMVGELDDASEKEMRPPRGFFKNSRLPGGVSSQASEIERNLGVTGP
jgi:hypothetical protein